MKSNYWEKRDAIFNRQVKIAESKIADELRRVEAKTAKDVEALYSRITTGENVIASDIYAYNRSFLLLETLKENLLATANTEIKAIEKSMRDLYITNSQLVGDEIGYNFSMNEEKIIKAIKSQWVGDGKIYSDRIWGNTSLLAERIQNCLVDSLVRGDSVDTIAGQVEREFNSSWNSARRLVRTELSYIQNKSAMDMYEEAGYTYYQFVNAGDDEVCDGECAELNGQIFPMSEAEAGVNFPPIHPNCRCGILAAEKEI